ncbi:MAG: Ig-like domain-containing protein [Candidatus Uhrbacteria bacterium]
MAQIFGKGITKVLPGLLVFTFAIILWRVLPIKSASAAAPTGFASQVYKDTVVDGRVDQIVVTIDGAEALDMCTVDATELASDWTYTGNGIGGSIASAACDTGTATITFTISGANANTTGTGSAPTIAYDDDDGDHSISNASGDLGAVVVATIIDNAAPFLVSAAYKDVTVVDGTVDRVDVTFSEPVVLDAWEADDWTFGSNSTMSLNDTGAVAIGSDIQLTVTAMIQKTGSDTIPTVTYTNGTTANSLHDAIPNNTATSSARNVSDAAAPYIITANYSDNNSDGEVDRLIFITTQDTGMECAGYTGGTNVTVGTPGTVALVSTLGDTCVSNGTTTFTITLTTVGATNTTGGSTNPIVSYVQPGSNNGFEDGASNDTASSASITVTDYAAPIIASITPIDGYAGYSRTGNIVVTFSESMNTGTVTTSTVTGSPTMGTLDLSSWASSNTILTANPSITLASSTSYTFTVSVGGTVASNVSGDPDMAEVHIHFTSASGSDSGSSSGSGTSTVTSTTPVITLTAPAGGSNLTGGEVQNVTWTTTGSGIDTVGIYYSADNGSTYNLVAYNLNKSLGTYEWTLPNIDSETVLVKIIAYDSGKGNLDSDVSTALEITAVSEEAIVDEEETPAEESTTIDDEGRTVALDSGETGPSPVTGLDEAISTVVTGQFIRGYSFNTIYYIDENNERRPFWDSNTFFTYADSFNEVVWVTDATLATLTLGSPMLPKAEVVLVKIQSDPKVYAIDIGDILHWVPSEATAIGLYGSAWADYVIDLEPTTFVRFTVGDDMTTSDSVDRDVMKTRTELVELAR